MKHRKDILSHQNPILSIERNDAFEEDMENFKIRDKRVWLVGIDSFSRRSISSWPTYSKPQSRSGLVYPVNLIMFARYHGFDITLALL